MEVVQAAVEDARQHMPFVWMLHPYDAADLVVFTDASTLKGVGGYVDVKNGRKYAAFWKDTIIKSLPYKLDIVAMEMIGVVMTTLIGGSAAIGSNSLLIGLKA
eukprot:710540_1